MSKCSTHFFFLTKSPLKNMYDHWTYCATRRVFFFFFYNSNHEPITPYLLFWIRKLNHLKCLWNSINLAVWGVDNSFCDSIGLQSLRRRRTLSICEVSIFFFFFLLFTQQLRKTKTNKQEINVHPPTTSSSLRPTNMDYIKKKIYGPDPKEQVC